MKNLVMACVLALLAGCATTVPPEVIAGYKPTQDIEAYCQQQGEAGGKNGEWIKKCTGEVAFRVRAASFCEACDAKGGNVNACLRQARAARADTQAAMTARGEKGQPTIALSCAATTAICIGFPDSATERDMKASRESKARFDMTSYPGAYCPLKKTAAAAAAH